MLAAQRAVVKFENLQATPVIVGLVNKLPFVRARSFRCVHFRGLLFLPYLSVQ